MKAKAGIFTALRFRLASLYLVGRGSCQSSSKQNSVTWSKVNIFLLFLLCALFFYELLFDNLTASKSVSQPVSLFDSGRRSQPLFFLTFKKVKIFPPFTLFVVACCFKLSSLFSSKKPGWFGFDDSPS